MVIGLSLHILVSLYSRVVTSLPLAPCNSNLIKGKGSSGSGSIEAM